MTSSSSFRVLHILEATLGGTRRYLEDIAAATAGTNLEQGLVYGTSRADSAFPALLLRLNSAGWYLSHAEKLQREVSPWPDLQSSAVIRNAIRDFRPTLIHAHSAKGGAVGRLAAKSLGPHAPPVVYSPHALPARLGRGYMLIERTLAAITKRFIAVSDSERAEIASTGVCEAARIDVVYPRIDAQYFAPRDRADAQRDLQLASRPIVIGIGRLAAQKDPLRFVEILAKVRSGRPDVLGIWVGDGELRAAVEAAAYAAGLGESFHITGWVTDVRPYIAACDILLSTSRYESFGYVIPEALAMDRPVIAACVTGVVDILSAVRDDTLYDLDRVADAAAMVERLLGTLHYEQRSQIPGAKVFYNVFQQRLCTPH